MENWANCSHTNNILPSQKEPSLIDLFEPAPVQQQQQPAAAAPAAAPFDPFFSDFAAAPTAAAATAAPTNPFFGDFAAAPTPAAAAAATAPPAADLFGLTAAVAGERWCENKINNVHLQHPSRSWRSHPLRASRCCSRRYDINETKLNIAS